MSYDRYCTDQDKCQSNHHRSVLSCNRWAFRKAKITCVLRRKSSSFSHPMVQQPYKITSPRGSREKHSRLQVYQTKSILRSSFIMTACVKISPFVPKRRAPSLEIFFFPGTTMRGRRRSSRFFTSA